MLSKTLQDLNFGILAEDELLDVIKKKYPSVEKTPLTSVIDYECDNYVIELKTRRCNHNKYPTTMIGKNKIDYMLKSKKRAICLFNFYDGLYEIEITEDVIEKFDCCFGGRHDRGKREYNIYYYIPVKMLTTFGTQKC